MTHSAFAALGLPDDADERAIKRAYARLLKDNRPDENPTGFQRLNENYKAALDDLKWRQTRNETDDSVGESDRLPVAPTDQEKLHQPTSIAESEAIFELAFPEDVDVAAFNERLISEAQMSDDEAFKR